MTASCASIDTAALSAPAAAAEPVGLVPPAAEPGSAAGPQRGVDPAAALLAAAGQGCEQSFAQLYQLTRRGVQRVVLGVVRCPDLAAEVQQEVYLEVWQQADRYRQDRASVLGWITMIARRRAVDRVRSVTRAVARDQRYARSGGADDLSEAWDDDVAARLDAGQVWSAMATLTPLQQQALSVTYIDQRPLAAAALLLGIPLPTMKDRVREARRRLRLVLAEPDPGQQAG